MATLQTTWLPAACVRHKNGRFVTGQGDVVMNIFVGHLAPAITNDDLRAAFSSYGTVVNAQVMHETATRKALGYGHVHLVPDDAARCAIRDLNRAVLRGRPIVVREFRERACQERRVRQARWNGEDRRRKPERRVNGHAAPPDRENSFARMPFPG
jgi:RNA recognition motif-containing protein